MNTSWRFDRSLDEALRRALAEEARCDGWWRDVLVDSKLILAPRHDCLDVYWKGQRLFQARLSRGRLKASTHAKYLLDPETSESVDLVDSQFQIDSMKRGLMRSYGGPDTLDRMKRAAAIYSDAEKSGVHDVVMANSDVIDIEVAFAGSWSLADGKKDKNRPRIDIVSLEERDESVHLVFWEAKLFSNPDLWTSSDKSVVRQIEFYRQCLRAHGDGVAASYRKVAKDQVAFHAMSGGLRPVGRLIQRVAEGAPLAVGDPPDVRLLVYNFDEAQISSRRWKDHRATLQSHITCIQERGATRGMKLKSCR